MPPDDRSLLAGRGSNIGDRLTKNDQRIRL